MARRALLPPVLALTLLAGLVDGASAAAPPPPARTEIVVTPTRLGEIPRTVFGANLLWPYAAGGAFDQARNRWYPAFVAMVRSLHLSALRYPGGTTADSFHWQRAIGPAPRRRDNEPFGMQTASLLNHAVLDGPIPSVVGPDEFGHLLARTGASGTVVVNFATGTVREAAGLVAYLTAPQAPHPSRNPADPSYWAAERARNGHRAPYDVTYVEVGNEQLVPAEYGWRSGALVHLGPHAPACPPGETAVCLYAFGGTTRFRSEAVGRFANDMPGADRSTGAPHQAFYVYYPPVVPGSLTVRVGGRRWAPTTALASAGPRARVYALEAATGRIAFGDGRHGAVPPRGARVTVDYESGPHGGFVEFYQAIKAVDPKVHVCETEAPSAAFLELMGRSHPYDCAEIHPYALPTDVRAPLPRYQADLMSFPPKQGAMVGRVEAQLRRYSGRPVPVVVTEYGQLVAPMPTRYPRFILSLDESLLIAAQLRQWIDHRVPLAEKYLLTSSPFLGSDPRHVSVESVLHVTEREDSPEWDPGLAIDSAMIAGPGPTFVPEPTGQVIGLMSALGGGQLLASSVRHGPSLPGAPGEPALLVTAASSGPHLVLVVANTSLATAVRATLVLGRFRHGSRMGVSVLDGPSATAYNTVAHPRRVRIVSREVPVGPGSVEWTFPAHSVTLLRL